MRIDEFLELARERRSVRKFKPDPIPDECIEKILEAARWAMSGANAQPWEFIVIKDKETKDKIVDIYANERESSWDLEKTRIREIRHPQYIDGPPVGLPGFEDAPVFIVVCADPRTMQASVLHMQFTFSGAAPKTPFMKNIGNATHNMHLAACACGLGSRWISVYTVVEAHLKVLLDVPAEIGIHTIVPIGYPADEPKGRYRRELTEFVHFEKYDRSKFRSNQDIYEFLIANKQRVEARYKQKFQ